jgi:nucleotide-binding universal stress UspA family protein
MNTRTTEKAALTGALSWKHILVAVDLSAHSEATGRYAIEIAKPFGATIVLVHVHPRIETSEFTTEGGYREMEQQRRDAQAALTRLAETLRESFPACESTFLLGDPAERIVSLAHDLKADAIITASHHPSFLARLLNLDQAPKIMHRAPCPVLVYHGDQPARLVSPDRGPGMQAAGLEPAAMHQKILAPVDLAAEPGPTLDFAVKLAREWNADLYLLHVYSAPPYVANSHYVYAVQGIDWHRRQLEAKLLDWVDRLQKHHPRTFPLFEDGDHPAEGIQAVAAALPADLIVVSTHDRNWLFRWFFYSEADEIARMAASPVLVMRMPQVPQAEESRQ